MDEKTYLLMMFILVLINYIFPKYTDYKSHVDQPLFLMFEALKYINMKAHY